MAFPASAILIRMSHATQNPAGTPASAAGSERRNLELKARLNSLPDAVRRAEQVATQHVGCQIQQDTYFHCRTGRLKLRTIAGGPAQLVSYARPDRPDAALSRYHLVDVPDAPALEQALNVTLGVWVVVRKRREIYLHHNVRIHLDDVAGLGVFLEFEAVLSPQDDDLVSRTRLDFLSQHFNLSPDDLRHESYSDMLAKSATLQIAADDS